MLGNSPGEAPARSQSKDDLELEEQARSDDNAAQIATIPSYGTVMSLEEELGLEVEDSPSDESPLREKNIRMVNKGKGKKDGSVRGGGR